MDVEDFTTYMQHFSESFNSDALWLPLALRHLLLRSPTDVQRSCLKQWKVAQSASPFRPEECHNDVFPLPLALSAEDLRWDQKAGTPLELSENCPLPVIRRAWRHCIVLILNTWAMAPQSCNKDGDNKQVFHAMTTADLSASQVSVFAYLDEIIGDFCTFWRTSQLKTKDWTENLEKRLDVYAGLVTTKAHDLSLAQVVPALPPEGLAGKVDAAALAEGHVRRVLMDPELLVRPRSEWPKKFKRAKIRASRDEYYAIVVELVRRRILRILEEHEAIFDSEGQRLGAGMFGVPKGHSLTLDDGQVVEILRLIINLTPTNALQRQFKGQSRTMGYPGLWPHLVLQDHELMVFYSEDQKACFHLYEIPAPWRGYFVLKRQVRPETVGLPPGPPIRVRVRTCPMGWVNAVDFIQEAHSRMLTLDPPRGGGLPPRRGTTCTS